MQTNGAIDKQAVDAKWREFIKGAFETFIETEVGLDELSRPSCFGTGNGQMMCESCNFQLGC